MEYDCYCDSCLGQFSHWTYAQYRLGTDTKKEDWTRGLELMVAGSRTVQFFDGNSLWSGDPNP